MKLLVLLTIFTIAIAQQQQQQQQQTRFKLKRKVQTLNQQQQKQPIALPLGETKLKTLKTRQIPIPRVPNIGVGVGFGLELAINDAWSAFKDRYNKVYANPDDERLRREIFIENTNKIRRFNEDFGAGRSTFVYRINSFADMLHHEFDSILNGFNRTEDTEGRSIIATQRASTYIPSANVNIPDSIDWRPLGAVTPVRSQGMCGACYAFSASGALEGQYFRKTGALPLLSPQNLIDCTRPYGNFGCVGGLMTPAFQYIKDNGGMDAEFAYSYEAKEADCRYTPEGFGADDTGYVSIPQGDEGYLKVAVATIGPISAAIDAMQDSFQFYGDGVYFDPKCRNLTGNMNHAILIVGYGTEPDGREYWLVKNSYGPDWGNGGYIKMARNAQNHCGIANLASYPLV